MPKSRSFFRSTRRYAYGSQWNYSYLIFIPPKGGGGTFGVVLEATFIASPRVILQVALVSFIEPNVTSTRDMWSIVVDQSLKWAEEGWGSFLTGESALFVTPTLNSTTAAASMEPLIDFGNKLTADNVPNVTVLLQEFPSWASFFNTFANTDSAVRMPQCHFVFVPFY